MRRILTTIILVVLLQSCSIDNQEPISLIGEAQGTYYSIKYYDILNRNFKPMIDSILHDFDMSVSLWEPESILSKVNSGNDSVDLDNYFIDNFNLSKEIAEETKGAFDFTIGALVKTWGFSIKNNRVIDSITIDSLLYVTGYEKVNLINNKVVKHNPAVNFDFNAIAQGYSVDIVSDFLKSQGIENFLVDIGGEVTLSGVKANGKKWRVGIEKPTNNANSGQNITVKIELTDKSLATSGNYRKFFIKDGVKYSHMIDPSTGYPAMHNLLSVTVIAKNTALADAYATACMVMGYDKAREFIDSKQNLEAMFIVADKDDDYINFMTKGFEKLVVN